LLTQPERAFNSLFVHDSDREFPVPGFFSDHGDDPPYLG
jgi:hypothetical protein